ncbi:Putative glycosyltransferase [Glycine soja]|nr:Putative glycosyltransferase [Glycine soja]
MVKNMTFLNEANSTGENTLEIVNETRTSEEKDSVSSTGLTSESGRESSRSLGFDERNESSTVECIEIANNGSATEQIGNLGLSIYNNTISHSPSHAIAPPLSQTEVSPNITSPMLSNAYDETDFMEEERFRPSKDEFNIVGNNSSINRVPKETEMNELLLQNRASYCSMRPRWSSAVDQELLQARSEIENAPIGWFMRLMEASKQFVTKDPKKAQLCYLPFSSRRLEETLYVPNSHSSRNLIQYLKNYVDMIAGKHRFWNRTGGADHFLVACHDGAPTETRQHMARCLRALCNADVKEGFVLGKDVSLPETYVRNAPKPTRNVGGNRVSKRKTLAFFAGGMHGYVRPILLQHWENKNPAMKIFGRLPKSKGNRNYIQYMKSSKYCICAKGYEVQQHLLWHKSPFKYDIFHMILHSIWYNSLHSNSCIDHFGDVAK